MYDGEADRYNDWLRESEDKTMIDPARLEAQKPVITSVFSELGQDWFRLGKDGVVHIRDFDRSGEMASVLWVEIEYEGGKTIEIPARYCRITREFP